MKYLFIGASFLTPLIALAAPANFSELIRLFITIIQNATTLVAGLAFLAFLWGIARFIFNAGDKNAIEEGKKIMIWGVVGLFVMLSIAGILNLLESTFFEGGLEGFDPIFPSGGNA